MKTKSIDLNEKRRTFIGAAIRGIDSKARTIRAYASTNAWDRYGERFAPDAFAAGLENFKKNPVILFAHDYSQAPIAKAVGYEFDAKGLILTMKFADTEKANEVFSLYEGGFMNAFSVGFRPLEVMFEERIAGSGEMGAVFVKAELLENSAVPVPANPEAVVIKGLGGKAMTLSGEVLRALMEGSFRSEQISQEAEEADPAARAMPDAQDHCQKAMDACASCKEGDQQEPCQAAMGDCMAEIASMMGKAAPAADGGVIAPGISATIGDGNPETIVNIDAPKSLKEAVGYLLTLGKAARANGKVEDEAVRSLLVQAVNLCRELALGSGAQKLDGMEPQDGEYLSEEDAALLKELEVMTDKLVSSGKATEKDRQELDALAKFIAEKVIGKKDTI